jgi:hypothetical protein
MMDDIGAMTKCEYLKKVNTEWLEQRRRTASNRRNMTKEERRGDARRAWCVNTSWPRTKRAPS